MTRADDLAYLTREIDRHQSFANLLQGRPGRDGWVESAAALRRIADRASRPAPSAQEWLPIESAPRDGTLIVAVSWYAFGFDEAQMLPELNIVQWDAEVDGWLDQNGFGPDDTPTLWTSLPAPPRQPEAGDASADTGGDHGR